jgi:large subunit ribosomal protein L30
MGSEMARVKITQTKSRIGSTKNQRANLDALGLHKVGQSVEHDDSKIILGMLEKVKHLVKFEITESAGPAKKAAPKKAEAPKAAEVTAEAPAGAAPETPKAETPAAAPKAEKPAAPKKAPAKPKAEGEKPAAVKKPAAPKKPKAE